MKNANKLLLIIGILLLSIFLIYLSSSFYQLLTLSLIIAIFVHPLKKKILTKINNESVASLLALLTGVVVVLIVILMLLFSLYNSVSVVKSMLTKNSEIELALLSITFFKDINFNELLTTAGINQLFNAVQLILLVVPNMLINVIIFSLFLFYFIKYGEEIFNVIRGLIPPGEIRNFDTFAEKMNLIMKSIFQAQFFTAFIQTTMLFIYLLILKMPYSFELSLLNFVIGFLGITGMTAPVIVNIYHFYLATLSGDYSTFIATLVFSLIMFFTDDFVKPLITKHIAKTNTVLFILGALGGITTLGLTGFIIGPLITSSMKVLFDISYPKKITEEK